MTVLTPAPAQHEAGLHYRISVGIMEPDPDSPGKHKMALAHTSEWAIAKSDEDSEAAMGRAGALHDALTAFFQGTKKFSIVIQFGINIEVADTPMFAVVGTKVVVFEGQLMQPDEELPE